jgi:hypothetical protein
VADTDVDVCGLTVTDKNGTYGPYPRFLDTGWDYAAAGSVAAVPVS